MLKNMLDAVKNAEDEADAVIEAAKADAEKLKADAHNRACEMINNTQKDADAEKSAAIIAAKKAEDEKDRKAREETDAVAARLRETALKRRRGAERVLREKMFS